MRRRQSAGLFLVINIVVSIAVALLVMTLYTASQQEEEPRARPTFLFVVTATPDPNQTLSADALQQTVDVLHLTVTAYARDVSTAQSSGGNIPTREPEAVATEPISSESLPTIDPALIPSLPSNLGSGGSGESVVGETLATPSDGCERYTVQSGDTVSAIANRFGVTQSAIFVLNSINDQTILNVGDELLIPSPSCEPDATPTPSPSPRPTFNLTLVAPTATLVPTVTNAQVRITQILNFGDITAEEVQIQNMGGEINLLGWTLSDSQGNIYTFPQMQLVPGSIIRVVTRTGANTPGFLYWNQNSPIWEMGETASLRDAEGALQSVTDVGGEIINFGTPGTN